MESFPEGNENSEKIEQEVKEIVEALFQAKIKRERLDSYDGRTIVILEIDNLGASIEAEITVANKDERNSVAGVRFRVYVFKNGEFDWEKDMVNTDELSFELGEENKRTKGTDQFGQELHTELFFEQNAEMPEEIDDHDKSRFLALLKNFVK